MSQQDPHLHRSKPRSSARHSRLSSTWPLLLSLCCLGSSGPAGAIAEDAPTVFYPAQDAPQNPIVVEPGQESDNLVITLAESGGDVLIEVVSEATGLPVSGILVEVLAGSHTAVGRTAADGFATILGVPAGEAMVRTRPDDPRSEVGGFAVRYAPGVREPSQALRLRVEDDAETDFGTLTIPIAGRIKARVVRPEGGSWPEVPVVLRSIDGLTRRQRRTDQDGRITFGGLETDSYRLWVDARSTDAITEASDGSRDTLNATPIALSPGELIEGIELAPDLGGRILGAVREEVSNFGIPGIEVRIFPPGGSANPYTFITDDLGFYLGWGLPTGSYKVYVPAIRRYFPDEETESEARAVRVIEAEEQIGIDLRGRVDADCRLPPAQAGVIEGRLKGVDFATIENAQIVVWSDADTISLPVLEVGLFHVGCLPGGIYRAAFVPEGYYRTQYHPKTNILEEATLIVVTAGDTAKAVDFEPDRAISIHGQLVAASDGMGVGGVPVRGFNAELGLAIRTVTDDDGAFRLDRLDDGTGLPAGSWDLTTDSLTIASLTPTPIRAIKLAADVRGASVLLTFGLPSPGSVVDWRLYQRFLGGETVLLLGAETHPEGLHARTYEVKRSRATSAFRLEVDRREADGVVIERSSWVQIEAAAALSLHPFPQPWDGRTGLQIGSYLPEGTSLELFGIDGRRMGSGSVTEGHISLEPKRSLNSGLYFLRWVEPSGVTRTERLVLKR